MLRQVPRKAEDLVDQAPQQAGGPRGGVEARLAEAAGELFVLVVVLERLGQRVDFFEREAERLADVADGRTRPVGDDLGRHAGPVAAVFLVDVLDHFLAPLVLEIDVDVGGLVALLAEEPLEQEIDAVRIDRCDPQAITDRRVGRRSAPLAEDVPPAGKPHQVPHREEVGLVMQFLDQPQLMLQELADFLWNAARITPLRSLPGEPREMFQRSHPGRTQLLGILVAQLVERERAAIGNLDAAGNGLGTFGKDP